MQKLLIATKNPAKLDRYRKLLVDYKLELVSLAEVGIVQDVAETEATFKDNAALKAKTYFELSKMPVLAEDGGLVIKSLSGWPGVHSRRVWGQNKREATDAEAIQEVIKRIAEVPVNKRQAYFVADVVLIMPDGSIHYGHGEANGIIVTSVFPKIIKGFPYRSIFVPEGESKTVAELEDIEIHKDYLPQRKQAIIQLDPYLKQLANYARY